VSGNWSGFVWAANMPHTRGGFILGDLHIRVINAETG
jgi:hypothetical protein